MARSEWGQVFEKKGRKGWWVRHPDPTGRKSPSGRAVYVVRYVGTKKAAERVLGRLRREHKNGTLVVIPPGEPEPAESSTVLFAIDEYIHLKRSEGRSPKTIEQYESIRRRVALSALAGVPAESVTIRDLETYRAWRREHVFRTYRRPGTAEKPIVEVRPGAVASNATVNRDLDLVAAALQRLVKLGHMDRNPADLLERCKERKNARTALSKLDVRRLVGACPPHFRPLVLAALFTGARLGELARLRWSDVNLQAGTVTITRSKVGNAGTLALHPLLLRELTDLRVLGNRIAPDGEHVFLNALGRPFRDPRYPWRRTLAAAGLADRPDLKFHTLRHTFAVHFLQDGAAITDLQAIMGHSKISTTQVYARMVDERMRASMSALSYGLEGEAAGQDRPELRAHQSPPEKQVLIR